MHYEENLTFDLGHLAAYDISSITPESIETLTQANALKLLSKIRGLEKEETAEAVFIKVPPPILELPREKPPPEEQPLSKWEKFRLKKGLGRRRKRSRMVYEPTLDDWVPRWGPYSAKKIQEKQEPVLESKNGEDPFEKKSIEKQQNKLKQQKAKLQNELDQKKAVEQKLKIAKSSTAALETPQKKRKIPRNDSTPAEEKQHNLAILSQISKKSKNK